MGEAGETGRVLGDHEQLRFLPSSGIETGFDLNEKKIFDCSLKLI